MNDPHNILNSLERVSAVELSISVILSLSDRTGLSAVAAARPQLSCPHLQLPNPTLPPTPHFTVVMSQPASPYPTQSSFYSTPPIMNPSINPDTPPPPPPKPSSHETSRRGTPQNTSSLQPPQQPQPGYRPDSSNLQQANYPVNHPPQSLPAPPTVEEGWLPDIVKDKS
jgi:hypothetical protein